MIGQQRNLTLKPLSGYELCSVHSSLIDEYGCLHKASKSDLVKRLGVVEIQPPCADVAIIDVSQLFYHIVWPHGGSTSDLLDTVTGR